MSRKGRFSLLNIKFIICKIFVGHMTAVSSNGADCYWLTPGNVGVTRDGRSQPELCNLPIVGHVDGDQLFSYSITTTPSCPAGIAVELASGKKELIHSSSWNGCLPIYGIIISGRSFKLVIGHALGELFIFRNRGKFTSRVCAGVVW